MDDDDDLRDLVWQLRRERLSVQSEHLLVESIRAEVASLSKWVYELAWLAAHHRRNLKQLVLAHQGAAEALSAHRAASASVSVTIENAHQQRHFDQHFQEQSFKFIEAAHVLGFVEAKAYSKFLMVLRDRSDIVAACLVAGERMQSALLENVIHTVMTGLYGSCLITTDLKLVVRMARDVGIAQLIRTENPRVLLRHHSSAFARIYEALVNNDHTVRLFLDAALHTPIQTALATYDPLVDDFDHGSSSCSSSSSSSSSESSTSLSNPEREWRMERLATLINLFINSLRDHLFCFPNSIAWLLRQLISESHRHQNQHQHSEREIYELCTDLLLTHFICPAIVDPENFGITDAPVSHVARFNLMQIAHALQILANSKYEMWDSKMDDLFSLFPTDCVSSLINEMLAVGREAGLMGDGTGNRHRNSRSQRSGGGEALPKTTVLLTASQLNAMISFLESIKSSEEMINEHRGQLESLLAGLPASMTNGHGHLRFAKSSSALSVNDTEPVLVLRLSSGGEDVPPLLSESQVLNADEEKLLSDCDCEDDVDGGASRVVNLVMVPRIPVGLSRDDVDDDLPDSVVIASNTSHEKRTRFSVSHDEGSIGNTSDNLEAISEAASNHSGASSLNDSVGAGEDQNDNLSDMISANVSGRGSPNISGRDTPSSQVTEGEGGAGVAIASPSVAGTGPPMAVPMATISAPTQTSAILKRQLQARTDIDDKFGKFEIKKQELTIGGDETVSLVSDTWSTDVLASDSETGIAVAARSIPTLMPASSIDESVVVGGSSGGPSTVAIGVVQQHQHDISETGSEAWSTDVMASDSERLIDVDTDTDTASVARSDDTAHSDAGSASLFHPLPFPAVTTAQSPQKPHHYRHYRPGSGGGSNSKANSISREIESGLVVRPLPRLCDPSQQPQDQQHQQSLEHDLSEISLRTNYRVETSLNQHVNTFPSVKNEDLRSSTSLASTTSSGSSNAAATMAAAASTAAAVTCTIKSTGGTIPKSISFDKTADKAKDYAEDKKPHRKSFFGNFKMFNVRGSRKVKSHKTDNEGQPTASDENIRNHTCDDSVEDILAKYRSKTSAAQPQEDPDNVLPRRTRVNANRNDDLEDETQSHELENDESIFRNAKRKLRLVLSESSSASASTNSDLITPWSSSTLAPTTIALALEMALAEARQLRDSRRAWQVREAQRCVRLFDADGRRDRELRVALRADLVGRMRFAAYLTRMRAHFMSRRATLRRLQQRLEVEQKRAGDAVVSVCVRLFLERGDGAAWRHFVSVFRSLSAHDEKTDLLTRFVAQLAEELDSDSAWTGASESQRNAALLAIETAVFSRVYPYAFYPNGDGDVSRDHVFYEHVNKLREVVTPQHKHLQISKRFLGECPWASAQAELGELAAQWTPRGKVQCVSRCAAAIMQLLTMSGESSGGGVFPGSASDHAPPAADDLFPVLVYVIIAANPPALLSTVQYVESFAAHAQHDILYGENHYWWTQFASAIELIKTMDYHDE